MEFRLNMVLKVMTDLIWYAGQISVFEVLFLHSNRYSDWDLPSVRVFLGILFFVDSIYMILFSENLDHLSMKVRKGDLDLLLVKPVNSQFMISFQKTNVSYILNCFFTLGYLAWAISNIPQPIYFSNVVWLFLLIPCGIAVCYSARFFFAALAVIFVNADNISYMWYQLYRIGTRPDSIYPSWMKYVILTILPVGFIASIPSRFVLGKQETWMYWEVPLVTGLLVYGSIRFWKFALTKYTSASS